MGRDGLAAVDRHQACGGRPGGGHWLVAWLVNRLAIRLIPLPGVAAIGACSSVESTPSCPRCSEVTGVAATR